MQVSRTKTKSNKWADAALFGSAHWDAFRAKPGAYFKACWWWLLGKKVRARNHFAPLLGLSSRAYRLWMRRKECRVTVATENAVPIILLIDARGALGDLGDTLRDASSENITTFIVGTTDMPTLNQVVDHIDWSSKQWILPVTAGDRLAPGAIATYQSALSEAKTPIDLVYADDDLWNAQRGRYRPHFKPDWNAELFRHFDYLSGACVLHVGREDLIECSAFPDWMEHLSRRIVERGKPLHLTSILHHRFSRPQPQVPAMPRIKLSDLPPISIIIPTRNRVDLLRTCIQGLASTDYPSIEILIIDNDSDDAETLSYLESLDAAGRRVLRHSGAFNFSEINNRAVKEAQGKLLCLLNNDIEVVHGDWLKIMAVQAQRQDVGAVGAQLLYPDGRIQHAGVTIGMGNAAGHAHRRLKPEEDGYFRRHALPHYTMAVTAACLVVERERFLAVGGLNEKDFAVAFNDVDLCLRLNQKGWQSLYEPRARLIHHESVSRGMDRDPVGAARFAQELLALKRLWRTDEVIDPFHHPQLSRASEQFVMQL